MSPAKRRVAGAAQRNAPTSRRRTETSGSARAGRATRSAGGASEASKQYTLRLYVAGQTPKSLASFANLKRLCEQHLPGRYKIEVIDLIENPQLAAGDQIFALPTLVRKLPPPLKRIIGNISDEEKFLIGMDLRPNSV
jgi:circadian clock protein KaiB